MKAPIVLSLPIVAALMLGAAGHEPSRPRCAGCGCSNFKRVCRLVCEMTEDIDYEYDVAYDDYCLPAMSQVGGKKWWADCRYLLGCRKAPAWQPGCTGKLRTRRTLVKVAVVKKVPTYHCVVDRVCPQCGRSEVDARATGQARGQRIVPESTLTKF